MTLTQPSTLGTSLTTGNALTTSHPPTTSTLQSSPLNLATSLLQGASQSTHTFTVTNTNDSGTGSLRAAIASANADTSGIPDAINFNLGSGTQLITLTSANLDIKAKNLTINDTGANNLIISGGNTFQDFAIESGAAVTISDLTITKSSSKILNNNPVSFGGGINNNGTLTLSNDILSNNTASQGGGINNNGTLTVSGSTFSHNTANEGAGIANAGTLTVSSSTFSNNIGTPNSSGGGIANFSTLTVSGSTFSNNAATFGGGIFSDGMLAVSGSTFSNNTASEGGGIISENTSTVSNSTFSKNTATSYGGGIANFSTLTMSSSTFSKNTATSYGGGIYNLAGNTVNVHDTIVAQNTAPTGADLFGNFTSDGFNLIGIEDLNATGFTNGKNGDMVGTTAKPINPELGALQNNGGSTFTEALLTGSPAINTGDPNNANNPTTDQRGIARPQRGRADIGAFELV